MNIEDVRSHYEIMMRNQPDFVIDLILDKNKDLEYLSNQLEEKVDEIDRLNNIIEELEKWLNEFETKEFNYNFLVVRVKDVQDKLKELKGE